MNKNSIFKDVIFKKLLIILNIILLQIVPARAADTYEWMGATLISLGSIFNSCIEVPAFASFHNGSQVLPIAQSGKWVSTGTKVHDGKLIKFSWGVNGVDARPRKYLVLYRIDPRFPVPQLFIQTYDYNSGKYVSDFHHYYSGDLINYQNNPGQYFSDRIDKYITYFRFNLRAKIPVYAQDVVNITLIDKGDFFVTNSDFSTEFSSPTNEIDNIYTDNQGLQDNKIIYSNANIWCATALTSIYANYALCQNNTYFNTGAHQYNILIGMNSLPFSDVLGKIDPCPDGANDMNQSPLCFYDNGRGMKITAAGKVIKEPGSSFINYNLTGKYFLYDKVNTTGVLDITTDWQINNMFVNFPNMVSWGANFTSASDIMQKIANNTVDVKANFLHFGRYLMSLEIGNGDAGISPGQQSAIKVEYMISDTAPADSVSGIDVSNNFSTTASRAGYLWLKVINPDTSIQGTITVNYMNYTGSTAFSDIVYNKLILPLTAKFNDLSKLVYTKLATSPTAQNIVKLLLTLYIAVYGLWFIAGAVEMTTQDLVIRVLKVSLIVILFSPNSWEFFNNYLFSVFTEGINYLMSQVIDSSSTSSGIFGFIDPIFDRYTNPKIWGLLIIQLLQIHNGMAFFAIMTIYSILTFFRAVLEIIIGYCLAFISLTVLISLAPLFLTFMLFEKTKSIFDNWISSLFDYTIQPTILLIFFLLIDQLIGRQVTEVITKACWGCLIPLEIGLDLRHMGIPIDFSFKLPFLDCIPFFVTQVKEVADIHDIYIFKGSFLYLITSCLLFYCYCTMARGLVDYVSTVTSMLTNVLPARREGKFQGSPNPTASIIGDMKGLVSPIKSAGAVFKDKVIDQNYTARPSNLPQRKRDVPTHVDKILANRRDGERHDLGSSGKNNTDQ